MTSTRVTTCAGRSVATFGVSECDKRWLLGVPASSAARLEGTGAGYAVNHGTRLSAAARKQFVPTPRVIFVDAMGPDAWRDPV